MCHVRCSLFTNLDRPDSGPDPLFGVREQKKAPSGEMGLKDRLV